MPASAATFVYVGNADSQDISVFELEPDGELTPVAITAVPGPARPGGSLPLAVSPTGAGSMQVCVTSRTVR